MKTILAFLTVILLAPAALAQDAAPVKSNEPLEITADKSLEWNRNDKIFTARENALAKQGESSVRGKTLIANYREAKEGGGMDIYHMEAHDNVELVSRDSTAWGDKADYDLDKGLAILTGDNLKMVSPNQVVTARDRFEYWTADGRFVAIGAAKVVRTNERKQESILEGDTISAIMKKDAQGKSVLDKLDARNNVVITTPTERVTGNYAIYYAATNKAEMTGNVVIHRGPNMLEGNRAEVDLNTNISQLFGGGATTTRSGQVRGIFYPGSDKKK